MGPVLFVICVLYSCHFEADFWLHLYKDGTRQIVLKYKMVHEEQLHWNLLTLSILIIWEWGEGGCCPKTDGSSPDQLSAASQDGLASGSHPHPSGRWWCQNDSSILSQLNHLPWFICFSVLREWSHLPFTALFIFIFNQQCERYILGVVRECMKPYWRAIASQIQCSRIKLRNFML